MSPPEEHTDFLMRLSTAIRNYDDVLQLESHDKLVQAASPLDVRKVSDFPRGVFLRRGFAPKRWGTAPEP